MGKKDYKAKEPPSNVRYLMESFIEKNLNGTSYHDSTYRSGRLDLSNGYSLHILAEIIPAKQSDSDRIIWCWSLAKNSEGGLVIDKIFQPKGYMEMQKLIRTVLSWPRYENSSVPLNPHYPTPFPRSLTPTTPPRTGSKGRSWLRRPPENVRAL